MEATYTDTRDNLASYWDKVVNEREPLTVHRRGHEDIAILPATELSSLMETAHLLRSPKNAQRLLSALQDSLSEEGKVQGVDSLAKEVGFVS